MKSRLIILSLCLVSLGFAQPDQDEAFKKRKPGLMRFYTGFAAPDIDTPDKFDRFNTDFFWNSWLGDANGVNTKFYAIGHHINLMFDIPFNKKSTVGIAIGLGYSHFNIRNDGAFSFIDVPGGTGQYSSLAPYTGPNRWINRTVFNFVEVPFEFRFRAKRERGKFKFYPGFRVGYMVENYIKWRIGSNEYKEFNFPDLNRIHYGPTIRIGVDNIFLFGYYDMTYLFTEEMSNDLQLFGVGISVGWF